MGTRLLPIVSAVLVVCVVGPAAGTESERIIVRKSPIRKALVAVPDFTEDGRIVGTALSKELSEALRFDLDNSGHYRVVADARGVADAQRRDIEGGQVLLPNWRGLDAEIVFKVDVRRSGAKLVIRCLANESNTGKLVLNRTVKGLEENARRLVHALSDEIVKVLVGAEGIARTQIAFIKDNPDGGRDLYLVDYDGHNLRRVTRDGGVAVSPDWSPDAGQVYYTSMHKGEPYLYRIDLARGKRMAVATYPGLNYAAAVSPDGKKLAVVLSKSGTPDIYTMDADGANLQRLTRSVGRLSTCPVWSHDGRRLAYVSNVHGGPQLYVMRTDGSGQRRLLAGYVEMTSLDWSPAAATSDLLVFSARTHGRRQLFVADVKKNIVKQLTFDPADHEDPNFAPDGRHIVYVREPRSSAADLCILDVFDPKPVRVTGFDGNEFYPAWSPAGY